MEALLCGNPHGLSRPN